VLVLEPANGGWKEGVQALVAELLTTGHELNVRAVDVSSQDLQQALQSAVAQLGVAAGVSVTRQADTATALLCRRGAGDCEKVEVDIAEGELSRSRLALAVVERLRPIDLPAAQSPSATSARPVPPVATPSPVERPARTDVRRFRAWLGGGVVLSSGTPAPMSWLGASFGAMLSQPWGVEVSAAGSPLEGSAESSAGTLSLRAVEALGFATFEPLSWRGFGFSLGLGGGTLHLRETASPVSGFDGFSRSATVAVVSVQARLHHRVGPVYWGLVVDPGMLIPALKVQAGSETLLRMGRPWVTLQASLGVDL
jgi:hypothetical protein